MDVACIDINGETPEKEIIFLKKIDDRSIFYRGTSKGKFRGPGGPISYCPEDRQRIYFEDKNKK